MDEYKCWWRIGATLLQRTSQLGIRLRQRFEFWIVLPIVLQCQVKLWMSFEQNLESEFGLEMDFKLGILWKWGQGAIFIRLLWRVSLLGWNIQMHISNLFSIIHMYSNETFHTYVKLCLKSSIEVLCVKTREICFWNIPLSFRFSWGSLWILPHSSR